MVYLTALVRSYSRRRMSYYISLSGQAPAYLADDNNTVTNSGCHLLQSATDRTCIVPRTHNSVAAWRVWNSLPSYLRQDINYAQCKFES